MSLDKAFVHNLSFPIPPVIENVPNIYGGEVTIVRNVFTPDECLKLIEVAEATGMVTASLYTGPDGTEHFSDVRKSKRCILDSFAFAEELRKRIQHAISSTFGFMFVLDDKQPINERLRFLRYDPGDEFLPHCDGHYVSPSESISKVTILIYLNADYTGGFTEFKTVADEWLPVIPRAGDVVLMDQCISHVFLRS